MYIVGRGAGAILPLICCVEHIAEKMNFNQNMTTFYPCSQKLEKVAVPSRLPKDNMALIVSNKKKFTEYQSFLKSCVMAYNEHHRLIITPDAVWLAIMTQFSVYLEKHAEQLRSKFVSFEGQKELIAYGGGNLQSANYPVLIEDLIDQIASNIKDPSVASWAIPSFSTTTDCDRIVGSLVLMAAMKKFFGYKMCLCCGLPAVTMLGNLDDWQNLYSRAERLLEFDCESNYMHKWSLMLLPVLQKFIDSVAGKPDLKWWNQIANHVGGGSGPSYYSGWITVFSVFNNNGEWAGDKKAFTDWCGNYFSSEWLLIDTEDITSSEITVNVTVDDNGKEYKTVFTAGVGGFTVMEDNAVMPVSSWNLSLVK